MSVKLKLFSSFILLTIEQEKYHLQMKSRNIAQLNPYTHKHKQFSYFDSYTLLLFAPFFRQNHQEILFIFNLDPSKKEWLQFIKTKTLRSLEPRKHKVPFISDLLH